MSLSKRRWSWPLYPFTCVIGACVLFAALIANFPAVRVPHADLQRGTLGSEFAIVWNYEHGWPLRYLRRDCLRSSAVLLDMESWETQVWQPWRHVQEFHLISLFADLAIWLVAVILAVAGAQYWRTRRRAIWQLRTIDLVGLVTAAAVVFGWIAAERLEERREGAAIAQAWADRGPSAESILRKDATVPAFLPESQQWQYRQLFTRVVLFNSAAQSDLAQQFSQLIVLRESYPAPDFRQHLAHMPQLEAIDLSMARLRYKDATRQTTMLHDLPSMPSLRGLNLAMTAATDADMAWPAKCRRLEALDLSSTRVGDEGIRHLMAAPKLRKLTIWGGPLTDESCRRLAEFPALERLTISSRDIHDSGVQALGALQHLRHLNLSCTASEEAITDLRKALPKCEITVQGSGFLSSRDQPLGAGR